MNTLEAIYQRRSVKGYDPEHKITPEEEQKLLEATIIFWLQLQPFVPSF